jgi:hypothetical protein
MKAEEERDKLELKRKEQELKIEQKRAAREAELENKNLEYQHKLEERKKELEAEHARKLNEIELKSLETPEPSKTKAEQVIKVVKVAGETLNKHYVAPKFSKQVPASPTKLRLAPATPEITKNTPRIKIAGAGTFGSPAQTNSRDLSFGFRPSGPNLSVSLSGLRGASSGLGAATKGLSTSNRDLSFGFRPRPQPQSRFVLITQVGKNRWTMRIPGSNTTTDIVGAKSLEKTKQRLTETGYTYTVAPVGYQPSPPSSPRHRNLPRYW